MDGDMAGGEDLEFKASSDDTQIIIIFERNKSWVN